MRKRAAERKAEIITSAIGLADKVGPDRITTEMIARAIGVTQATIFRHFPKKEDIWSGVALQLTGIMREAWGKIDEEGGDPVAQLEATVLGHLRLIEQMPALPAILMSRELHADNAPLRKVLLGAMGGFRQRLAGLIEQATAAGTFRQDLAADDGALLLIGLVQSLAIRWSLSGKCDDLVADGNRLLATQLVGFLAAPGDRSGTVNAKAGS